MINKKWSSYTFQLFQIVLNHMQICCFVNKNLLLFCRSSSVAVVVGFVVIHK